MLSILRTSNIDSFAEDPKDQSKEHPLYQVSYADFGTDHPTERKIMFENVMAWCLTRILKSSWSCLGAHFFGRQNSLRRMSWQFGNGLLCLDERIEKLH
jgi:hypothetical protein